MRIIIAVLLAALLVAQVDAEEQVIRLKVAPGRNKVEANCTGCHSLDYIQMNSPFLSPAGWDAELAKMIDVFGAPIDASDAKAIADYLKANYGMIGY
jgi:hypothetical protein